LLSHDLIGTTSVWQADCVASLRPGVWVALDACSSIPVVDLSISSAASLAGGGLCWSGNATCLGEVWSSSSTTCLAAVAALSSASNLMRLACAWIDTSASLGNETRWALVAFSLAQDLCAEASIIIKKHLHSNLLTISSVCCAILYVH